MRVNKKKLSLAKSNSVISHMKNESNVIPLDDPENLNKYLNCISKKNNKEKKENINIEIKELRKKT